MTRYLARRLLNYLVLLALASFLTYCLTSLAFSPLESLMQRSPRPPQAVIDAKHTISAWTDPYWPATPTGYRMPSVATSEPPSPASLSVPNWGAGSESACGCWSLDRYSARWPVW